MSQRYPALPNDPAPARRQTHRNHQMDLLRIGFAACVLLSHAPELSDGNASRDLLHRLSPNATLGSFGVDGFFLLSGYLIVKSWQISPNLLDYLRKRILRIVPGYLVAALLSTLALGLLIPAVPHYFSHFGVRFPVSVLLLSSPMAPKVGPGMHYHDVNGSLWTITYEFRCYLLVALFGICGLFKRPVLWLILTVFLLSVSASPPLQRLLYWHTHYLITEDPAFLYHLNAAFFVGGCFYLFRSHIRFHPILGISAALAVGVALRFPAAFEDVLDLCGGYLLFYLTSVRFKALASMDRFPDISYGLYVYGWPVEMLLIWYLRASPWIIFPIALCISACFGWVSWHYIERPMLKFKRRSSAPLPG